MNINYTAMNERETYVPEHMRDGFKLWIEHGISPGSFGRAVLNNDLKGACGKADHINKQHLFTIVAWFYNYAPCDCWGHPVNVTDWEDKFRSAALNAIPKNQWDESMVDAYELLCPAVSKARGAA